MTTATASRREVVTSLALGAGALTAVLAPTAAAADEHERPPLRHVQRRLQERQKARLDGADPLSREGLHRLTAGLREDDLITTSDEHLLDRLIDTASDFFHVDEVADWISSTYRRVSDEMTDLARTMFEYVKERFEWARRTYYDTPHAREDLLWSISLMIAAAAAVPVIGWPAPAAVFVLGVAVLSLPDNDDSPDTSID